MEGRPAGSKVPGNIKITCLSPVWDCVRFGVCVSPPELSGLTILSS